MHVSKPWLVGPRAQESRAFLAKSRLRYFGSAQDRIEPAGRGEGLMRAQVAQVVLAVCCASLGGCQGWYEEQGIAERFLPKAEMQALKKERRAAKKAAKGEVDSLAPEPVDADAATPVQKAAAPVKLGKPQAPRTVVMVMADGLRADHASFCGYKRPTTPFLNGFAKGKSTVHSCAAYATGTRAEVTLASAFTGLTPARHGVLDGKSSLAKGATTLAKRFKEAGYQTMLIAASGAADRQSGLQQGFDVTSVAQGPERGEAFLARVQDALGKVKTDKSQFVVVHLSESASPFPTVEEGTKWLPPTKGISTEPKGHPDAELLARLQNGKLGDDARKSLRKRLVNSYDLSVRHTDEAISSVFELLHGAGLLKRGYRAVVMGTHGEFLGEHDLVGHFGPPWEPAVRVPLIFRDTRMKAEPSLPVVLSITAGYWLAADGEWPQEISVRPVASVRARPGKTWRGNLDSVAVWDGAHTKLMWANGKPTRFDLKADPHEMEQLPIEGHTLAPRLRKESEALRKGKGPKGGEANASPALKEVGFN